MDEILEKIRTLRLSKGYTQEYMAEKLSIDPVNYGRLERGQSKLTIDRFLKICKILEVDPVYFFSHQDSEIITYLKKIYDTEREILKNIKK